MQRVAKNLILRGNSYTFRKVIPLDARDAFGGVTEYVRSFGDVTRRDAEQLATFHRTYCERLIAEARGQSKSHNPVQLVRIKRVPDRDEMERVVREWLLDRESSLGTSLFGADGEQKVRDIQHIENAVLRVSSPRTRDMPLLTCWIAEGLAERNGWILPSDGELLRFLEDRVGRAQYELSKRVEVEQQIGKAHQPTHPMFAASEYQRDREHGEKQSSVSITTILDGYLAERKPAAKTVKKWSTALNSLIAHLGHEDAGSVRPDDIVTWKDALLQSGTGRAGQTVRNGYIGAAKAVFGWAKRNRLMSDNPASGITVHTPPVVRNRPEKGFTEAEAKLVLAASLAVGSDANHSFGMFARRWLPWLCAYTGARVAEMAQLRREDIGQTEDGIWYVTVRPEAGSQKGHFARQVALHPHLIEQGFVEAVTKRSGPLFYDPANRRKASSANPQYTKAAQRVAVWVRKTVGLDDPELQPNHGWRHRFVTVANDIGIPDDVCRAILGHAARDVHQSYGNVLVRTSFRWLSRYPRYEFVEARSAGVSPTEGETSRDFATGCNRGGIAPLEAIVPQGTNTSEVQR
ncbi:tyrosine-type recombinase/integrase [Sphingomonas agri]|uniref:tyrosine-type recombinase/integrase n=1 Tax=Sphingomonas agri TaxID=1813878 RepID=UPI00311E0D22